MNKDFYLYIYSVLTILSGIRKHQWDVFITNKHYDKYAPEKKSGLLGVVANGENGVVNAILPERPMEGSLLKESFQCLHYYDYLLERTRTLFQIKIYNIPLTQGVEDELSIKYGDTFDIRILEFLIRAPKPITGDLSDIIDQEEMSADEYVERGYYQRSMDRINQSILMSEEEAQAIISHWHSVTKAEYLLEMIPYLYPVNELANTEYIAQDTERLWYCLYSFGLWYKEHLPLGKMYETIDKDSIQNLEVFLRGEDILDSPIRSSVYEILKCVSEEEFTQKLDQIKGFYTRVTDNLRKKGKKVPE